LAREKKERETGLIPSLLPLLKDTNSSHTHLVIFVVKILQNFMDYNNSVVTMFRDIRGLDNIFERLHEPKLAKYCATRDKLLVQLKNNGSTRKKEFMLKRASSAMDGMEIFTIVACEVNETSKMNQSSFPFLGQSRRRMRHTVVSSDSNDITSQETVLDISKKQLQVNGIGTPLDLTRYDGFNAVETYQGVF